MNHHIDDEAEDKAARQNQAAVNAAKHDFEHWSKTGEVRSLKETIDKAISYRRKMLWTSLAFWFVGFWILGWASWKVAVGVFFVLWAKNLSDKVK